MPRSRSPNRDKAFQIYDQHQGKIKIKEIAKLVGVKSCQVSRWKKEDNWEQNVSPKVGAPYGNQNATGNQGGASERNKNAEKHGFYAKYFPEETREIIEQFKDQNLLDNLWESILIQKAIIIRAQHLMYVRDQNDITKELKKSKSFITESIESQEEEFEIQFPWDKHATMMQAQSRAMATLNNMIKQYDQLVQSGFGSEHQRLRMEKLKAEVSMLKGEEDTDDTLVDDWVESVTEDEQ